MVLKTDLGLCFALGCECRITISAAGHHFMRPAQEQSQHLKADRTGGGAGGGCRKTEAEPGPNHEKSYRLFSYRSQ